MSYPAGASLNLIKYRLKPTKIKTADCIPGPTVVSLALQSIPSQ